MFSAPIQHEYLELFSSPAGRGCRSYMLSHGRREGAGVGRLHPRPLCPNGYQLGWASVRVGAQAGGLSGVLAFPEAVLS